VLAYPFLLRAFNAAVTASGGRIDTLAAAPLAALLLSPAVALWSAARLGALDKPRGGELLAKRIAILTFAAPPIFTFLGVLLYMAKSAVPDEAPWIVFWLLALVASGCALMSRRARGSMAGTLPSTVGSTKELARAEGYCEHYAAKLMPLAWLAPDLVEAILDGRQPRSLSLGALMRQPLPTDWAEQRSLFAAIG
jgi:hypothetical protein